MSPFDRVLAIAQLMLLGMWEALGALAFGWNPLYILGYWFVGLWSFNILVATAVRTYYKLITPTAALRQVTDVDVEAPEITEDDIG